MKKVTLLGMLFALAISASAQPNSTVPPNTQRRPNAVGVPPVAKVPPVVVRGGRK